MGAADILNVLSLNDSLFIAKRTQSEYLYERSQCIWWWISTRLTKRKVWLTMQKAWLLFLRCFFFVRLYFSKLCSHLCTKVHGCSQIFSTFMFFFQMCPLAGVLRSWLLNDARANRCQRDGRHLGHTALPCQSSVAQTISAKLTNITAPDVSDALCVVPDVSLGEMTLASVVIMGLMHHSNYECYGFLVMAK